MLSHRNSPSDHAKRTMGLGTHRTDQRNGTAEKRTRNAWCRRMPLTESCGMVRSCRISVRCHQQQIRDISTPHWHNHTLLRRVVRPHLRRNTRCTPKQSRLAIRPHRQMWCQRNPSDHDGRERSHRTLVRTGPCVWTPQPPTRKHPGHPSTHAVGNARSVPFQISFLGRTRFRIHGAFWKFFVKKCSKPLISGAALTQGFVETALQAAPLHRSQTVILGRQSQSRDSTSVFGNQPQILRSGSTRLTGLNSKTAYLHWP